MNDASHHIADAPPANWVERFWPVGLQPYAQLMRLDRPIGWWLLLLPCWWGLLLAQLAQGGGVPNLWYAALFAGGAIIMRGAGCTVNDLADRKIDAQVARTRLRPLPSGRLSVRQALVFLGLQTFAGLLILLQFNSYTVVLGASSLAIIAIYPFMKRITYWPQFVLGLAFNWGALVGWSAVYGGLGWPAMTLYVGGIFWTLAYDTIYAHQDKDDDILIGVKSTALMFGSSTRYWLAGFFALSLAMLDLSIWLVQASIIAHMGVAAAALQAVWQVIRFKPDDSDLCLKLFKSNRGFGLLITAFLLLDCILP